MAQAEPPLGRERCPMAPAHTTLEDWSGWSGNRFAKFPSSFQSLCFSTGPSCHLPSYAYHSCDHSYQAHF
ncbi:hypothetical protein CTAM01_17388 [Colletotrichum tamarilloi]|uniref:Uncharacterized protein n=1 Tax=Colletotrichum tamarilloi TaxID=1209934 RepID=A0ABQ9QFP9_9PEZI|nr:uncharacterized protein CTAM01_17388 [Colletotrichum tamarilloi]KAK1445449.1 hypothetical protein CTAM01_17388 [Colletotrichum tamarilloi]